MDEKMDFTNNDDFDAGHKASCEDISSTSDFVIGDNAAQMQPKRSLTVSSDGEPPAKKSASSILLDAGFKWNLQALANAADAVQSGGKSPVSALNELGVRVSYTVVQQGGPPHCPSFSISVNVADMTFEGVGHSKREARASAARACLNALLARAGRVLPMMPVMRNHHPDFTSDEDMSPAGLYGRSKQAQSDSDLQAKRKSPKKMAKPKVDLMQPPTRTPPTANSLLFGGGNPVISQKSPINTLYETYPGLVFHCTYGDGTALDSAPTAPAQLNHSMRFKVVCQIKEQKFEGYGSSKKFAKLAAAQSAMAVLLGASPSLPAAVTATSLAQPLADLVARLVTEKFHEVTNGDLVHSKRKVLAGIVITINNRIEGAKVIAVTTGTKCVSGEHMSVRGHAVNDCHAEVVARRCLQRYLYAQLYEYAVSADPRRVIAHSDIEPHRDEGYRIKGDRQVHLYVSTAPCGDARIFSPHEQPADALDRHPNRMARGQLRTKIESGEGTIPVKNSTNAAQTWDGVLQGERLLTMSCSDKVARWCVVGLQGALLSRYMRPVYLTSLVLGSLLHVQHTTRALCGRIEQHISSLPPPFQLQRPLLARAASAEARTPARAPSFAVCWCATSEQAEVLNAMTGKLESGQPSLVCKQSMFARWQYLATRLPHIKKTDRHWTRQYSLKKVKRTLESKENPSSEMTYILYLNEVEGTPVPAPTLPSSLDSLLYHDAKQLCPVYQDAKQRLVSAFEKAQLGRWIKRPIEQDQFPCELGGAPPSALFA